MQEPAQAVTANEGLQLTLNDLHTKPHSYD